MIRRVILDLDGTLISGVDFNIYAKRALDALGIDSSSYSLKAIQDAICAFENEAFVYDKDFITLYFEVFLCRKIGKRFINQYLLELRDALPEQLEDGVVDTLDYLKEKYELSILTNWFRDSQEARLKNMGLYNYFDHFVYGDIAKKPNPKAYLLATNGTPKSECVMVGDSYSIDYDGALKAGVNAILLDKKDAYDNISKKQRIRKLSDLRKIL